jgi:puromycin-sensitive aminopeptidase
MSIRLPLNVVPEVKFCFSFFPSLLLSFFPVILFLFILFFSPFFSSFLSFFCFLFVLRFSSCCVNKDFNQVYTLTLVPDLDTFTFQGYVSIKINVKEVTTVIRVHALDLTFKTDENSKPLVFLADVASDTKMQCQSLQEMKELQQVGFDFGSPIRNGDYILSIQYVGVHNDQLAGFYRSKYITAEGKTKYMVTTQMEPCDCRRALPCWDEPNLKAVFVVTLIVPKGLTCVSNMPVTCAATLSNGSDGRDTMGLSFPAGLVEYRFMPSPIMSSYLLAFVVGEFDYLEANGDNNVAVRVYTPVGKTAQGVFALDCATRCLKYFNEWFGIPYPLPKVDLLAIPDFAAGAMENWGCITYREARILIDQKVLNLMTNHVSEIVS